MSNISSNSLFHFTSNLKNLIGILTNDFFPRFSYETLVLDFEKPPIEIAIPMVCFCDISLSQIASHINTYGHYGVGMSKEWGLRNKLNPIIYLNENSFIADAIFQTSSAVYNLIDLNSRDSELVFNEFMKIINFLKPYMGDFKRKGEIFENYRYYDEREWRYIPAIVTEDGIPITLSKIEFENIVFLSNYNKKLIDFKLNFLPNDIKYIFVKSEDEIHTMIDSLRNIKGNFFDTKTIDILSSKIITTTQILEDF